jgi:hypothetical protein
MVIRLTSLISGAADAVGTTVIIDVFRAFTTAAIALSRGARCIMMVDSLEAALALRDAGVGDYCIGERDSVKPLGFDFGNSPAPEGLGGIVATAALTRAARPRRNRGAYRLRSNRDASEAVPRLPAVEKPSSRQRATSALPALSKREQLDRRDGGMLVKERSTSIPLDEIPSRLI